MPSKELFVSVIYYEGTAAERIRAESSSNVVAFRIPRIKAADFRNDPELKRAGIYFLLNTVSKSIYVGQADARSNGNGILGRMTEPHSRPEIDNWDVGIALTNNSALFFDATKLNYLERLFYDKAKIVNKYSLLNGNAPSSTTINPADRIMSQNYCDSSLFVLENILKIDAFSESVSENVPQRVPVNSNSGRESSAGIVDRKIYLKSASNSVDAVGIFKAKNHIIVKAGSKISSVNHLPNQRGMQSVDKKRRELIDCGIIRDFTFACDCDFTSVSMPATIILGRSANGWAEWKDSAGDAIDKYRNTLE